MYYTTLAWPAVCPTYRIESYHFDTQSYRVIDPAFGRPVLGYSAAEEAGHLVLVYPMLGKDHDMKGKPYAFPINDPPSLATIRWLIRAALNDTEVETGIEYKYPEIPKWADKELDGYIRECLGFFNTYLPKERTIRTAPTHISRRDLQLAPGESIKAVAYESHLTATNGQPMMMVHGSRRLSSRRQPMWDVDTLGELSLYFLEQRSSYVDITVNGPYSTPHNDLVALDLPREHWEILSVFGQGKSYLRLAGQSAQLDRWKETGIRTDNPISPVARRLLNEAMDRITGMKGPVGMRRTLA